MRGKIHTDFPGDLMRFHVIVRVALVPALLAMPILGAQNAQNAQTTAGHASMSMPATSGRSAMMTGPMGTRGPSGLATVDGAAVTLTLQADVVGATRSWYVGKGSCGRDQGIVASVPSYPPVTIDPQGNGTATARLAGPLVAEGSYFVAVRSAASDPTSAVVVCGALTEAMGTMPMGTMPMGTMPMGTMPMGTMPMGTMPMGTMPMGTMPMGTMPMGTMPMGTMAMGTDSTATRLMAIYARMMADPVIQERVMTDPVLQRMMAGMSMSDSMGMPLTMPSMSHARPEAAAQRHAVDHGPATPRTAGATARNPLAAPAKSIGPLAAPRTTSPPKAAVKAPAKKDSMPGMKMPAGMKMPPTKIP
jgi:hypothetical protein